MTGISRGVMGHLHSIYFSPGGDHTVPEPIRRNLESFRYYHPSFEHRVYSLEDARGFLAEHLPSNVSAAFETIIPLAYKSDLFRYCLLYALGGVYADVSLHFFQPVVGDSDERRLVVFRDGFSRAPWIVSTSLIYAPAKHPVFKACISDVLKNVRERRYGYTSLCPTGPNLFGSAIARTMELREFVTGDTMKINKSGSHSYAYLDRAGDVVAVNVKRGSGLASLGSAHSEDYNEFYRSKNIYKSPGKRVSTWSFEELPSNGSPLPNSTKLAFEAGVAVFGPYTHAAAGRFRAEYRLSEDDYQALRNAGYAIDVCTALGTQELSVVATGEHPDGEHHIISAEFETPGHLQEVEVRLRVERGVIFELEGLTLREV